MRSIVCIWPGLRTGCYTGLTPREHDTPIQSSYAQNVAQLPFPHGCWLVGPEDFYSFLSSFATAVGFGFTIAGHFPGVSTG